MRWRYVLFLMMLPLLLEVLIACCNCTAPPDSLFVNSSLVLHNMDNTGIRPAPFSGDSLSASVYAIRARLERSIVADVYRRDFHLIASANATSCECDAVASASEEITGIRVITLFDHSEAYPAGSDISDAFRISSGDTQLARFGATFVFLRPNVLNSFVFEDGQSSDELSFDLFLIEPPASPGPQQFVVQLLSNEEVNIEQTTTAINLF